MAKILTQQEVEDLLREAEDRKKRNLSADEIVAEEEARIAAGNPSPTPAWITDAEEKIAAEEAARVRTAGAPATATTTLPAPTPTATPVHPPASTTTSTAGSTSTPATGTATSTSATGTPNAAESSDTKDSDTINGMLVWYAVAALSYASSYNQTIADLLSSPTGRGIFEAHKIHLTGLNQEDTKDEQGKAMVDQSESLNNEGLQNALSDIEDGEAKQKLMTALEAAGIIQTP